MNSITRIPQAAGVFLLSLLVTMHVSKFQEEKATPWDFWQLALLFIIVAIVITGAQLLLERAYNSSEIKKYDWEENVFKIESEKLGFTREDIEDAKYKIRNYLLDHPQSTTQDLLDNLDLPAVFTSNHATEDAFRLGGLISICRYGQDPVTKEWSAFHSAHFVKAQYKEFQKHINSQGYKKALVNHGL